MSFVSKSSKVFLFFDLKKSFDVKQNSWMISLHFSMNLDFFISIYWKISS